MNTKHKNRRSKKKGLRKYSYAEFLILFAACTPEHQKELTDALAMAPRPSRVCGKIVPADLNGISYGQLEELSECGASKDPITLAFSIILGLDAATVYEQSVVDVIGFGNFINKEIERINTLFESIQIEHSPAELSAGVDKLNFGAFGVLDWYARRMGIVNQNDVRDVAWVRIFTCMKNDNEQAAYERRLNRELTERARRR